MPERAGVVAKLWRYPVKSMGGESVRRLVLGPHGAPGDRGWALMGEGIRAVGPYGSGKQIGELVQAQAAFEGEPESHEPPHALIRLPDGQLFSTADPGAEDKLSAWLGRPVTLRRTSSGEHFDDKPVHVVTTATLESLKKINSTCDFDPRRFRPNVLLELSGEGFPEQAWIGRRLRVGSVLLSVVKATKRCVMTTLPQGELIEDREILNTVARSAEAKVGVYAVVEQEGAVSVGDEAVLPD